MKTTLRQVLNSYNGLTNIEKLYLKIRWHLCPFEIIEQHVPKSGFIVDVGCGCGLLPNVLHFKSKQRRVLGIDLSSMRLRVAKKSEQPNIIFERKNVSDLKLESCDAIVMSDFLHHIPYEMQERIITEASNKLKEKGKLLILDNNTKPTWKFLFGQVVDKIMTRFDRTYYREKNDFKELLNRKGFSVTIMDVHKGLPLPDVLFVCTKE